MRSPPRWTGLFAGAVAALAAGTLTWVGSCGPHYPYPFDMAPALVDPTSGTKLTVINRPMAAALDSTGQTVYVTGVDQNGVVKLFSLPAAGGTPMVVATSVPLQAPISLAIDSGNNLYVVDLGTDDGGTIYRGTTSGMLSPMAAGKVLGPSGIAVTADGSSAFVTGRDPADGLPGVFQIATGTGAVVPLAKGAPFSRPAGVTLANDGTLYVIDATSLGTTQGAVIKVSGGTATRLTMTPIQVGFPAGIAGTGHTDLLVTSNAPGGAGVFKVKSTGDVAPLAVSGDKLSADGDPGTITRAAGADVWVAVDTATPQAGTPVSGAVLLLRP